MQAIALTATGPTIRIDQPAWYLALDPTSRALVDLVLVTLDRKAPSLSEDERARVFWNAMRRLGVPSEA